MFWELVTIDYQGMQTSLSTCPLVTRQLVCSTLVNLSTRQLVQQVANLLVNLSTRHSSTCPFVPRQLFNNINKNCGL